MGTEGGGGGAMNKKAVVVVVREGRGGGGGSAELKIKPDRRNLLVFPRLGFISADQIIIPVRSLPKRGR